MRFVSLDILVTGVLAFECALSSLTSVCESACDLTPNRLPTVTLVGHTINSSIQCVAMRGLGSDLDAVRAPDPTPNNKQEANQPLALENIERQRLQCRQNAQLVSAQRAQERDNESQDDSQGYKRISVETFELDAKTLAANQSKISLKGAYHPTETSRGFCPRNSMRSEP